MAEYVTVGLPAVVARTRVMAHYFDDSQVAFFTPGDHGQFAYRVRQLHDVQDRAIDARERAQRHCDGEDDERDQCHGSARQGVDLLTRRAIDDYRSSGSACVGAWHAFRAGWRMRTRGRRL